MKILVVHGPNLDRLGTREPDVYGTVTLQQINEQLEKLAKELRVELVFCQSNDEGTLVTRIGDAAGSKVDGILINPAAYTHTSVALHDAIKGSGLPCVEVHLSNTHQREAFRHVSLTASACLGQIMGFGAESYRLGLCGLVEHLRKDLS